MGARIEWDVPVTMRDGVTLRADVYRPDGVGPWPVIVVRTPYDKSDPFEGMLLEPLLAVRCGLIAVVQDVRGRYASEGGEWQPLATEAADGADTIAWAATIKGSNGRVGMWGPSYMGNVQWQAASQQPSALGAIAPSITFRTDEGLQQRGGAYELGLCRSWSVFTGFDALSRRYAGNHDALGTAMGDLIAIADEIPGASYAELPTGATPGEDPFFQPLGLPTFDMDAADVSRLQAAVAVPVLNIGGWFDVFLQGTLDNFAHGSPGDRLIVGPWNHIDSEPQQGDLNFGCAGAGAAVDLGDSINKRTFDWLREQLTNSGSDDGAPVMVYTMGANRWRTYDSWPPNNTRPVRLHLDANNQAAFTEPTSPTSETYIYDPLLPVPTLGGNTLLAHPRAGSVDHRPIEHRDDVLVFTTDLLIDDVEVTGRVSARLAVSTDAPTTDWVVRVCDVHPDGSSYNVVDGITRVVHTPGQRTLVDVDLWSTSMLFKKGHRIRVHVTSSSFPRWDRNLNTTDGLQIGSSQTAHQSLHLGSDTYVSLPVVAVDQSDGDNASPNC